MSTPTKGGGQVQISSLKLYHNSVKTVASAKKSDMFLDLLSIYAGFNMRESITQPFMTAEIMINDSNDIIADYPIVGGEIFHIVYSVPSGDDDTKVSLWFRTTGIRGIIYDERKQGFTLQLISESGFKNLNTNISTAFTGAPHDIVAQVYDSYLRNDDTKQGIAIDRSTGGIKVVCPRWKPSQIIRYVMNRAVDYENDSAGFFFFQTPHGFRFLSTSTLLDAKRNIVITDVMAQASSVRADGKLKKGYHYKIPSIPIIGDDGKPTSGMVGDETMQNVDDFRVDDRQLFAEDITKGYIASKHITHDIFHKSYNIETYNYFDDFSKQKRLAKFPQYVNYEKDVSSDVKVMLSPKHTKVQDGYKNLFPDDYLSSRHNITKQINDNLITNFQVPGNPIFCSGRLLEFNFPAIKKVSTPDDSYQKKYSGMYLIRDCIHIMKPVANATASYKCDANIVRDGFNEL